MSLFFSPDISEISKNSELSQKEKQTSHNNLNDSFCHGQGNSITRCSSSKTISNLPLKHRNDIQLFLAGWKRFRCSCYYKFTEKKNWTDSRTDCQSKGADLVIITTREEHVSVCHLVWTFWSELCCVSYMSI